MEHPQLGLICIDKAKLSHMSCSKFHRAMCPLVSSVYNGVKNILVTYGMTLLPNTPCQTTITLDGLAGMSFVQACGCVALKCTLLF